MGLSGLGGIVSPRTQSGDRFFDERAVEARQHIRGREDNLAGFTRLQLEHTPTKRMALKLAAELEERRGPCRYQAGYCAAVTHAYAMHRVCTRAASLVAHQVGLTAR